MFTQRTSGAVAFALVCAALVFAIRPMAQTPELSAQAANTSGPAQDIEKVADLSELRPVTDGEQARATHFARPGVTIQELLDRGMTRTYGHGLPPLQGVLAASFADERNFTALVCKYAVIAVGVPLSRKTLLTRTETDLFTDYTIDVSEWLRFDGGRGESVFSTLGGDVDVNGRGLSLQYPTGPAMIIGTPYVLFGRPLNGGQHGFLLEYKEPVQDAVSGSGRGLDQVLHEVRATALTCR